MDTATTVPTIEEYRVMLKRHDWHFEFADEGAVYRRGNAQRFALNAAQPIVDPDCAIWNEMAPVDHKKQQATA